MGAVSFSLDTQLVQTLQSRLPLTVLLETGTYQGETLAANLERFEQLISIELAPELFHAARQRFSASAKVKICQGDSPRHLQRLQSMLRPLGVLYWLDAHWCAGAHSHAEASQCPLLAELQAIGALNPDSVILIDDARLFLAPPLAPHEIADWPDFHQICLALLALSPSHRLMVLDDVIAFYPQRIHQAMRQHAHCRATDWMAAHHCLKQHGGFLRQIEQKEEVIQAKEAAIQRLSVDLQYKERLLLRHEAFFALPIVGWSLRLMRWLHQHWRSRRAQAG